MMYAIASVWQLLLILKPILTHTEIVLNYTSLYSGLWSNLLWNIFYFAAEEECMYELTD